MTRFVNRPWVGNVALFLLWMTLPVLFVVWMVATW